MKESVRQGLRLPIGCDDFGKLIDNQWFFVDKSLFIREVIQDTAEVILITRPRRFGKTLNLSLLRYFFAEEVRGRKTAGLFDQLQIAQFPECMSQQGQYPVISLTFKDLKYQTYHECYQGLCQLLKQTYKLYIDLMSHKKFIPMDQQEFIAVLEGKASKIEIQFALVNLTRYLYQCYGREPIVLIDEYDTAIQAGYQYGYYKEAVELLRGILSPALKNNEYLKKAVLTGVVRIAKEGMFSGLNNVEVYSLFHQPYSEYFGFTEAEVQGLLLQSGLGDKAGEVRHWYNGYQIGTMRVYNPWSITHYLKYHGRCDCYWLNTSDNSLLKELLLTASVGIKAQFQSLFQGERIQVIITDNFIFPELKEVEETLWALFVMAGYLTPISEIRNEQGLSRYTLDIPNREIRVMYAQFICEWLAKGKNKVWYQTFIDQLLTGNVEAFAIGMQHIILQIASVHDLGQQPEAFYHGLMLGLILYLEPPQYRVVSNRESGYGRYDIAIIPQDTRELGIILELKSLAQQPRVSKATLAEAAKEAVKQIHERAYMTELTGLGFQRICKIGLAFRGKELHIDYEIEYFDLS